MERMSGVFENSAIVISNHAYNLNALGAVRSLGYEGVKVTWLTSEKSKWYSSKYCEPMICPDFKLEPRRFISFLLSLGETRYRRSRCVLIPTSDPALILLSKNKKLLEKYFIPLVCDWSTAKKFIDKRETYQIANSVSVPYPKTFYPKDENEAIQFAHEIDYPCILKPASSHEFAPKFNKKLLSANNANELMRAFRFFKSNGFEMMIQEEIPGEDRNLITLNTVLNEQSQPLAIFMHRRLIQNPPKYGVVALGESIWEPKIIEPAMNFLKAIKFTGLAQVELKQDPRTKDYKLIEVNGRSYLSISLPTACGINLIYLAYRNAKGEYLPPLSKYTCRYKCGVRWLDFPSLVSSLVRIKRTKSGSVNQLIRQTMKTNKIVLASLSIDDPAPFLMEINYLLNRALKIN
jgi:predicted ATP-grasp superfamily ATP-dependent carboligase